MRRKCQRTNHLQSFLLGKSFVDGECVGVARFGGSKTSDAARSSRYQIIHLVKFVALFFWSGHQIRRCVTVCGTRGHLRRLILGVFLSCRRCTLLLFLVAEQSLWKFHFLANLGYFLGFELFGGGFLGFWTMGSLLAFVFCFRYVWVLWLVVFVRVRFWNSLVWFLICLLCWFVSWVEICLL